MFEGHDFSVDTQAAPARLGHRNLNRGGIDVRHFAAIHVHRVDHHHVPVAGLGLLDDGEARTRALELLDVHLDAGGVLEGLQQVRVGMVAPDQGIEILGGGSAGHDELEIERPELVVREGISDGVAEDGRRRARNGAPDRRIFQATYIPLEGNFTSNLRGGDAFVQIGLGVSTYYGEPITERLTTHNMAIRSAILLTLSNAFMTLAWYGHLKFPHRALWVVVLISWGVAFFEYWLAVPANRIGYASGLNLAQLKIMQEVITLIVFAAFMVLVMGERLKWNHAAAFVCMVAAVAFVFLDKFRPV